jgi:pimeloyl-ACP methyl ester carboxylesterase
VRLLIPTATLNAPATGWPGRAERRSPTAWHARRIRAPRLKAPALLISGRFDWIFLGKDALLNLLGTPKEQ